MEVEPARYSKTGQPLTVETVNVNIDSTRVYIASRVSDGTTWVAGCNQFDGPYDCQFWKQLGNAAGMFKDVYIINGTAAYNEIVVHNDAPTKNIDGTVMGKIVGVNQWNAPSGGLAVLEIHGRGWYDVIDTGDVRQVKIWGDDGDDDILADGALQVKGGNGMDALITTLGNGGLGNVYGEADNDYFCNFGSGPGVPAYWNGGSNTDSRYGYATQMPSIELDSTQGDAHTVCMGALDDIIAAVLD